MSRGCLSRLATDRDARQVARHMGGGALRKPEPWCTIPACAWIVGSLRWIGCMERMGRAGRSATPWS